MMDDEKRLLRSLSREMEERCRIVDHKPSDLN
jgi:hypothetical protein